MQLRKNYKHFKILWKYIQIIHLFVAPGKAKNSSTKEPMLTKMCATKRSIGCTKIQIYINSSTSCATDPVGWFRPITKDNFHEFSSYKIHVQDFLRFIFCPTLHFELNWLNCCKATAKKQLYNFRKAINDPNDNTTQTETKKTKDSPSQVFNKIHDNHLFKIKFIPTLSHWKNMEEGSKMQWG